MFAIVAPWANLTFQEAEGGKIIVPIRFLSDNIVIGECTMGSLPGLDSRLDYWIWFGRLGLFAGIVFWLAFWLRSYQAKEGAAATLWLLVCVITASALLTLVQPIAACQFIQLPPPLLYQNDWQPGFLSALILTLSVATGFIAFQMRSGLTRRVADGGDSGEFLEPPAQV